MKKAVFVRNIPKYIWDEIIYRYILLWKNLPRHVLSHRTGTLIKFKCVSSHNNIICHQKLWNVRCRYIQMVGWWRDGREGRTTSFYFHTNVIFGIWFRHARIASFIQFNKCTWLSCIVLCRFNVVLFTSWMFKYSHGNIVAVNMFRNRKIPFPNVQTLILCGEKILLYVNEAATAMPI